jgi:RNA polymerase sigma-70 factor (ECF subfamily)
MRSIVVKENESEWLVRAIEGDQEAFARLVELYQKPVYNLCYRMLGTSGDAEDAAQESFLRAYKNLQRYDTTRPFATWLLSIASHYCIDQLRKRRFNAFSIDDDEKAWLEPPDPGMGPEKTVSVQEKQAEVQLLIHEARCHEICIFTSAAVLEITRPKNFRQSFSMSLVTILHPGK